MPTPCSERAPRMALAVLAVCALAAGAGCSQKQGWAGKGTQDESPEIPREWPQGRTETLKVTAQLVLSIPQQYERAEIDHRRPARPLLSVQSDRAEVQFDFFLPDFSGYTLQNYKNESDESKVEVVYLHAGDPHEAEPDAAVSTRPTCSSVR